MVTSDYHICPHRDCIYHTPPGACNGCDYFIIQCERGTPIGERLRGCKPGKNCIRYEPGEKKRRCSQMPSGMEQHPVDPEKATELWKKGLTNAQIAHELEVPTRAVAGFLKAHDMKAHLGIPPAELRDNQEAQDMVDKGATDVEISAAFGVSEYMVRIWRESLGIQCAKKRRGRLVRVDYEKIAEGYAMGLPDWEIKNYANCSKTSVERWRQREKLPPHNAFEWERKQKCGCKKPK